jgi:phosphoenolpyruvate-protein phosphotransferase
MPTLILLAPVSGPMVPLESVPDPVFAGKLAGDGVAIDPVSSTLLSPCDAEVLFVHPSGHAITLRTAEGVELILHIGLDTVTLKGQGFTPLKRKGDAVRAGEPLIDFQADYIATHAPSLLTEVLIATPDLVTRLVKHDGYVEAGRDPILELVVTAAAVSAAAAATPAERLTSPEIRVTNPTGLHARPAAILASTARRFDADVRLHRGARDANARSVTAIMALEINGGDRLVLSASGTDARAALDALVPLMESGLDVPEAADAAPPESYSAWWSGGARLLRGVGASPGVSTGRIVAVAPQDIPTIDSTGTPAEEQRVLDRALAKARQELGVLASSTGGAAVQAAIFRAHLELLDDPDLVEFASKLIAGGTAAATAWHRAFTRLADRLSAAKNEMFAERSADLRDVGRRVLRLITGTNGGGPVYPDDAVVVAQDLTPSETAAFDRNRVRGFCTVTGGRTSHVAILARSFGIPAIAGIDAQVLDLPPGTRVVLDGTAGVLLIDPSAPDLALASAATERDAARRMLVASTARQPAVTLDGLHIHVAANAGTVSDAVDAAAAGADGIGLLRSEFLFMDRANAPDEDEQYEAYATAVRAFGGASPVTIRTLDVGGDKPLSYVPLPREQNPFLGLRGIRIATLRADLLRTQLQAILRASRHGRVQVMFPMVTTYDEWLSAKRLLEEVRAALGVPPIPAGIMVEVPAVALTADVFAADVEFFSIGTNDLAQYTLAMDRSHPTLAPQLDALHPAVLHLIDLTVRAARQHGRRVAVCGALASEEDAVPILLGLGVEELSVSLPVVPAIKERVRTLRAAQCRSLAASALAAATAPDVRALVRV